MPLNKMKSMKWGAQAALQTTALVLAAAVALTFLGGLISPAHALNPIMHNSSSTSSTYWGGGWGNTASSKYGKFVCNTCHIAGLSAGNTKQIKSTITTPNGTNWASSGTPSVTVVFNSYTTYGSVSAHSTSTRVCEVCHSQTAYHKYNQSATPHNGNVDCMTSGCHSHSNGFKKPVGGCTSCHGNPPTVSTYGTNGLATQGAYGGNTNFLPAGQAGAHARHYTQLAMTCNACHTGYTTSPMGSGGIEIGISISSATWPQFTGPAVNFATYTGNFDKASGYSYVGRNGTVLPATLISGRNSCNVYCHGGWSGSGKTMRPNWTGTGTVVCGTCHGASAAAPPTRASHPKHAGNGTYTGYSISCTTCHPSRATGNTAHITGSVQWQLSTGKAVVGANAKYNGAANGSTGALAPSASYATCTQVYCHSNGRTTATYNTPTWGGSQVANCTRCHGNSGATFRPMSSNAHRAHVNNTIAKFSGLRIACNECHNLVVYANTTSVKSRTLHVNGAKNNDWGTVANFGGSGAYSAGNCSSVYCHSTGQSPNTYVPPPNWQTTSDGSQGTRSCDMCHGGIVGDTTVQSSNKHLYHVPDSPGSGFPHVALTCDKCHRYTVNGTGTAIITTGAGLHLNTTRDARFKAFPFTNRSGTYTAATNSCANTYCHGNTASGSWKTGSVKNCGACHSTNNDGNMSAPHVKHYNTATLVTKADGWTNTNNSTGTTNIFKCGACHNTQTNHVNGPQVSGQGDAQLSFNLPFGGGGDSATKGGSPVANGRGYYYSTATTCSVYCHSNGRGKKRSPSWTTGGVTCGSCHANGGVFYDWSSAHNKHLNTYKLGGSSVNCYYCHSTTVNSTSTSIANVANHPNGTKTVVSSTFSNFTWSAGQCSAGYCHSAGNDFSSPYTSPKTITWAATTTNCGSCHGASAANPEPNYASGSPKANSHAKHASGLNYQCVTCHSRVVDALRNISSHSLHVNKTYQVNAGGGFSFTLGNTPSDTTAANCTNISCHNNGSATWGGAARKCSDCHGTTGADVNNYVQDGTGALINTTEWTYSGHGRTTAYIVTSNPAANFPAAAGTGDPCEYCHDKTLNHYDAANPLRLRNFTHATYGKSGVCLACHGTSGTGVDPDGASTTYANKTATKKVNKYHYGSQHSATLNGGQFCWDCHDGHGDSTTTAGPIIMAQKRPALASNATTGVPTSTATADLVFSNKAVPGDLSATASPFTKICNICHTYKAADPNKMVHYTNSSSDSHNSASLCTTCHKHNADDTFDGLAYKGLADCLTCHASRQGTGVNPSIIRAAVYGAAAGSEGDDFIRKSRHVSNGTIATPIVTNFDCIVCHAEGNVASSGTSIQTVAANHGGDGGTRTVDLRDVDSSGGTGIIAAWPGARLSAQTITTTHRNNMDSFCMGCHDSNGASQIAVNNTNNGLITGAAAGSTTRSGASVTVSLRPFNTNDNLRNNFDSAVLGTFRTTTYGRVLDVKSQFNSTNQVGSGWASHHNLNQFSNKRYSARNTTYFPNALFVAVVLKETANLQTTGETTGLHCSDCHLNEANAHGSRNSRYNLDTVNKSNGTPAGDQTASLGSWTDAATYANICYKCHAPTAYDENSTAGRFDHSKDSSRTLNTMASPLGIICFNCHGGYGSGANGALGTIHGTNETYTPGGASATTKRYRFMSGAVMRFYRPEVKGTTNVLDADWADADTDSSCYTTGASDTWNGSSCNQHSGGVDMGSGTINYTKPLSW